MDLVEEGFDSLGVALEPEVEELLWGFVGGEGVYVVEVEVK